MDINQITELVRSAMAGENISADTTAHKSDAKENTLGVTLATAKKLSAAVMERAAEIGVKAVSLHLLRAVLFPKRQELLC